MVAFLSRIVHWTDLFKHTDSFRIKKTELWVSHWFIHWTNSLEQTDSFRKEACDYVYELSQITFKNKRIKLETGVLNHSTTLIYSETNQYDREAQQNLLWCFLEYFLLSEQKIHKIIVYKFIVNLLFIELLFKKQYHFPSRVVSCCLHE